MVYIVRSLFKYIQRIFAVVRSEYYFEIQLFFFVA